jgi:hypothetical protein
MSNSMKHAIDIARAIMALVVSSSAPGAFAASLAALEFVARKVRATQSAKDRATIDALVGVLDEADAFAEFEAMKVEGGVN